MRRRVILWTCDHCHATAIEPTTWEADRGLDYCDGEACVASRLAERTAREVYEASVAKARKTYENAEAKAAAELAKVRGEG